MPASIPAAACSRNYRLATGPRRQSLGRHPRRAVFTRRWSRRHPGPDRQHRIEAGHHHPARRHRLQVSKAGVKVLTEGLAHELRNIAGLQGERAPPDPRLRLDRLTAARRRADKPKGAWTPEQTVDFMLERWAAATSTCSARTTTCRTRSTSGASNGPRTTSSRTAPRCRAGIRLGERSKAWLQESERNRRCPISTRTWRRFSG